MATDASPQLDYTTQPPSRRRWLRLFIALAILGAIVVGWFQVREPLRRYLWRREYDQQAASWYAKNAVRAEPASLLKYSDVPADAAPANAPRIGYGEGGHGQDPALDRGPVFTDDGPILDGSFPTVFSHELTNTIGQTRLIRVIIEAWRGTGILLATEQIAPMPNGHPQAGMIHLMKKSSSTLDLSGIATKGELRLFAGQVDPADPARFWIPFTAGTRRGRLVGMYLPGKTFSSNADQAKIEAEANSDVKWSVAVDHADPTTVPAAQ